MPSSGVFVQYWTVDTHLRWTTWDNRGAPPPPVILLIVFWSLSPTFIVLSDEIHVRVSSFFLFCYVRKILELDAPLGAQSLCKVWFHNFDNISLFHLMLVNFTSVSAKCQHGFIFVFCRFCCLNMNGRQTKIKYCYHQYRHDIYDQNVNIVTAARVGLLVNHTCHAPSTTKVDSNCFMNTTTQHQDFVNFSCWFYSENRCWGF